MNYKTLLTKILAVFLLSALVYPVIEVTAQTPNPQIDRLTVAVWPEYDKPEVLVMHRITLNPDTPLPAQLTFRLPGYIDQMHAIALNTDEGLINVTPDLVESSHEDDEFILSFPVSGHEIHLEYYDPVILSKQGKERELNYNFVAPYAINALSVEIQQPFEAENFLLTPKAQNTITGGDRLKISTVLADNLSAGDTVDVKATYQRDSNALSVQALQQDIPDNAVDTSSLAGTNVYMAYGLLGVGVLLLVGTAGYWFWQRKQYSALQTGQRQPRRKKVHKQKKQNTKSSPARPAPVKVSRQTASYCHQCGSALRGNARFCHICGAERRG